MIGTPFTSNNPIEQRKINRINKKPWEQEVRDDKGRRRFHGAFTGGFSAGYFNTVGSKEGWKPKDKYDREKKQNVMDFMDEEDIQLALGNNLITLKEVDKGKKEEDALDQLLGKINNDKLSELQETLLKSAGFDLNKDKDVLWIGKQRIDFKCKEDFHGVGYTGNNTNSNRDKQSNNEPITNIMRMNTFENDSKLGFYNERDTSEYNFEEIDEHYYERRNQRNNIYNDNNMPQFIKSKEPFQIKIDCPLPVVPKDFNPYINMKPVNETPNIARTIQGRASLLIDKHYLKNQFQSQNEVVVKNQIENYFNFKLELPFKDNIAKISRFAKFLSKKEGLKLNEEFTFSKEEEQEFEELYELNQKRIQQEKQNFIPNNVSNKQIEIVVTKEKWKPSQLLCKKMKIKPPIESEINQYNDIQKKIIREENRYNNNHKHNNTLQEINNEINTKELVYNDCDVNLFEEIFK